MSSSGHSQQTSSSEADVGVMDQRKRKRMLSNRESARRSRQRKQQHLEDLINQAAKLKAENEQVAAQIEMATHRHAEVESGNAVMRTQLAELTDRLKSVNGVLRFLEDFSGMEMDIPEIPDPLLKPWHLPCPSPAILASHNMLQY